MLMNLINLVGNYICVYLMGMGAAGVAIPTLISRIVAAIVMFALCMNKENPVYILLKDVFSFQKDIIAKILSLLQFQTVWKMGCSSLERYWFQLLWQRMEPCRLRQTVLPTVFPRCAM